MPKKGELHIAYYKRCRDNSALAVDQYVIMAQFSREIFEQISFERFSSLEIINFFKHHMDMTKSFVLKEINLEKGREKMDTFIPAVYSDYISSKQNKVNVVSEENA